MTAQPRSRVLVSLPWFVAALVITPGFALASPNAGGVLNLHAIPNLAYSISQTYCGQPGPDLCAAAVASLPWQPGAPIVFHGLAAFPPGSSLRLKGISIGIDYNSTKFVLTAPQARAEREAAREACGSAGGGLTACAGCDDLRCHRTQFTCVVESDGWGGNA